MAVGDRNDPEWAWYWQEADADERGPLEPVIDPQSWSCVSVTAPVERESLRDPDQQPVELMRKVAEWLPSAHRLAFLTQYKAGGRGATSMAYLQYGIPQTTWSSRVDRAEEMLAVLVPAYLEAEGRQKGLGSLQGALRRVRWPDTLLARVSEGSTAGAASSGILGAAQSTVWSRCRRMAETEPMLAALMSLRSISGSGSGSEKQNPAVG